jgi:uncharacterized protein YjbI with pentapeptide repeats
LDGVDLTGVDVDGTKFSGVVNLSRCTLDNLRGAILNGTDLSGVDLKGVDLNRTRFSGVAGLSRCRLDNLRGAILYNADLSSVDLRGKDLAGTEFSGVKNLGRCMLDNLRGAILDSTNLSRVNLNGVDFTGVLGLTSALSSSFEGTLNHRIPAAGIKGAFKKGSKSNIKAGAVVWHHSYFAKAKPTPDDRRRGQIKLEYNDKWVNVSDCYLPN